MFLSILFCWDYLDASYLFDGLEMENDSGVSLAESCRRAQERLGRNEPLFQGLVFYFAMQKGKGKQTSKGVVITPAMVRDTITPMIEVCSGKVRAPASFASVLHMENYYTKDRHN